MSAPLPTGLRARVLAAAREARPAGRPVPDPPPVSPVEAFSRAADAFAGVLAALEDQAWATPVLRDLDVQGLVGHLTGVEDDVRRAIAGDPAVAAADHVSSTQPAAERQAGRTPEQTRRGWRRAVDRTLTGLRDADLAVPAPMHGMPLPLGALLVVRAFELWTHENDVRRVVGLPPSVPDPATMRHMTDLAAALLPEGVARVAADVPPVDVHLVLTGPGGGTWDVRLGDRTPSAAVPAVAIVADAVAFCRLVGDRIAPSDLDAHLTGGTDHAEVVLAGAAALALD